MVIISGMSYEEHCQQCIGGWYCELAGATTFDPSRTDTGTGICDAGYYCKSGRFLSISYLYM